MFSLAPPNSAQAQSVVLKPKKQKLTKVYQKFWFYVLRLVDKHSRRLKNMFKAVRLLEEKKTENEK